MRQRSILYYFPVLFLSLIISPISSGRCSASIQDLLKLPEDKIDIGLAALTLAREVYPEIDVSSYSARIDHLAAKVWKLSQSTRNPRDPNLRVRCLNTVLYLHENFRAVRDVSFANRKPAYYYLNRVLTTKQGNCFSMPLLYVAVGQRLGWPIYMVDVPDHAFVRYVDPAYKEQNIEATSGGGYVPNERYVKDFLVSEKGRKSGAYLRTRTRRDMLGQLIGLNGVTSAQRGQLTKAIAAPTCAAQLSPTFVNAWSNLAQAHKTMAKRSSGADAEKHRALAAHSSKKLKDLGFVHPKDVPPISYAGRPTQ